MAPILAEQRAAWGIKTADRPFTREEKKVWNKDERKMYKCFELHGKEQGILRMRAYLRDKREAAAIEDGGGSSKGTASGGAAKPSPASNAPADSEADKASVEDENTAKPDDKDENAKSTGKKAPADEVASEESLKSEGKKLCADEAKGKEESD